MVIHSHYEFKCQWNSNANGSALFSFFFLTKFQYHMFNFDIYFMILKSIRAQFFTVIISNKI